MTLRIRLSEGGKQRTVYVEHGVFYDPDNRQIMVTVPKGSDTVLWSYRPKDPEYQITRRY
jgi:hypothetical protein